MLAQQRDTDYWCSYCEADVEDEVSEVTVYYTVGESYTEEEFLALDHDDLTRCDRCCSNLDASERYTSYYVTDDGDSTFDTWRDAVGQMYYLCEYDGVTQDTCQCNNLETVPVNASWAHITECQDETLYICSKCHAIRDSIFDGCDCDNTDCPLCTPNEKCKIHI